MGNRGQGCWTADAFALRVLTSPSFLFAVAASLPKPSCSPHHFQGRVILAVALPFLHPYLSSSSVNYTPFLCLQETARSPFTYLFVVAVRHGLQKTFRHNLVVGGLDTGVVAVAFAYAAAGTPSLLCFESDELCVSGHTVPDASAVSFLTFRVGILSLSSLRVFRGLPAASPSGLH